MSEADLKKRRAALAGLIQSDAWQAVTEELARKRESTVKRMVGAGRTPLEREADAAEVRALSSLGVLPQRMLEQLDRKIGKPRTEEGDVH